MSNVVFRFSQSKINTKRRCDFAAHLAYNEKIKPIEIKRPFTFGGIVHDMLDAECNGKDPMRLLRKIANEKREIFDAQKEQLGEIVRDIRWIMQEYLEVYEKDPVIFLKRGNKRAEHAYEVEVEDGLVFEWRVDAFAKMKKSKLKFLWENKTGQKQMDAIEEMTSVQAATYIRGGQILGLPEMDGIAWNFVLSKPPTVPQLLKDGTLGTRKDIITLPQVVRATIKAHGLKAADYEALFSIATAGRARYFRRRFDVIKPRVVENVWRDFIQDARRMADDPNFKNRSKHLGRHCSWCDYKAICLAELTGKSSDKVKEIHFEPRTKKEESKQENARKSKPQRSKAGSRKRHQRT